MQEDRRRAITEFMNNELAGGKRRWQSSNAEPKTVFSRLSARVPSTADDSADEDDNITKVIYLRMRSDNKVLKIILFSLR